MSIEAPAPITQGEEYTPPTNNNRKIIRYAAIGLVGVVAFLSLRKGQSNARAQAVTVGSDSAVSANGEIPVFIPTTNNYITETYNNGDVTNNTGGWVGHNPPSPGKILTPEKNIFTVIGQDGQRYAAKSYPIGTAPIRACNSGYTLYQRADVPNRSVCGKRTTTTAFATGSGGGPLMPPRNITPRFEVGNKCKPWETMVNGKCVPKRKQTPGFDVVRTVRRWAVG